jgi:hypothetical protein
MLRKSGAMNRAFKAIIFKTLHRAMALFLYAPKRLVCTLKIIMANHTSTHLKPHILQNVSIHSKQNSLSVLVTLHSQGAFFLN